MGAHYREASRARSRAEFVSKIESGLQELEEAIYWVELLRESDIVSGERFEDVNGEAQELLAILVASVKTAKRNA